MDRRNFLLQSSLTGLSMAGLSAAGCRTHPGSSSAKAEGGDKIPAFVLDEVTIDVLQEKMRKGEWTSRSITELYLKRIAQVDIKGPALHAVIELNPDALAIADERDRERKEGKVRGPLHGIPVLVKDNIDTGDQMMTTAGSLALEGHRAAKDAFIIARLRASGAVLLGKTNLSEWANFRSSRSTSAWSSRGGQTRCPYILDRNPSGSSAGSGAAVAANLCAIAIGTETNGSIVSPASVNGIVGIKPTVGLWSRSGIIPISATQDTAGPMARTVKDAALLLGALTGLDEADAITKKSEGHFLQDYTSFLKADALHGQRIGIEKSFLQGPEGGVALYKQAIDVLRQQGAEIVEIELVRPVRDLGHAEGIVLQYEFKDGVNRYLAGAGAAPKSLSDIIAFNRTNEGRAMPYFKQDTLESSEKTTGLDSQEYIDALKKTLSARDLIDNLLQQHQLQAIVGVTNGPAGCIDLINGDYGTGFYFSSPAALAGYPHITVPMGMVEGLPMGLSFVASAYQEAIVIGLAYSYEQADPKRRGPGFVKNFLA